MTTGKLISRNLREMSVSNNKMKTWSVVIWVHGFDGELTIEVTAETEQEAHEFAYAELREAPYDVTDCYCEDDDE